MTVLADATQIHQIVVNLCTNAANAMEDRGMLDVSLTRVSLSVQDLEELSLSELGPGMYAKLSIRDTGTGMSRDTMLRIFDPYFTTKEVGKGAGLGLAVVHGIVKSHGGQIRVFSELGKGSLFEVLIPAVEKEVKTDNAPLKGLPRGAERILLVDDEPQIAEMAMRMLGELGYRVSKRINPRDAHELFRSNPGDFDLIVTDFTMPHMSGIELAAEIMKIRPEMRIVICTGFSERVDAETARSLGIRGFALKPINKRQLAELVRNTLDEGKR